MSSVDLQYLVPPLLVWDLDLDLSVKPAWSSEGRVQCVGPIGGCYHYDLAPGLEAVHQGEQLADDPPLDFTGHLLPLWSYRVDLVDEDDGRRLLPCLLEYLPESRL